MNDASKRNLMWRPGRSHLTKCRQSNFVQEGHLCCDVNRQQCVNS